MFISSWVLGSLCWQILLSIFVGCFAGFALPSGMELGRYGCLGLVFELIIGLLIPLLSGLSDLDLWMGIGSRSLNRLHYHHFSSHCGPPLAAISVSLIFLWKAAPWLSPVLFWLNFSASWFPIWLEASPSLLFCFGSLNSLCSERSFSSSSMWNPGYPTLLFGLG